MMMIEKNDDASRFSNGLVRAAGVFGFLAVALGAFGAHALEERLAAADRLDTWETAVLYHLVHAVALFALASWTGLRTLRWVGWLWISGVIVFSGSLYLLCLTGATWLGAITPLGGLCFLAGWSALVMGAGCRHQSVTGQR